MTETFKSNGPPPWLWLGAVVLAIGYCLYSMSVSAAPNARRTEIRCFWQTCTVMKGNLAVCATSESGSTDEMLSAERQNRGRGKMLHRECVFSGEEPELLWQNASAGMFMKQEP